MNEEPFRGDPDALLARVHEEEQQQGRGKLKIFLGYAAGVGKTYTMLEAARHSKAEGVDVVVGLVETHGRAETEALIEGLEVIPRRSITYRGVALQEMDLDAVLARQPYLALVDELAHSNAPGSRHPKRYQDVAELLEAGINVYTTLNVQHLESLNDVVAQITSVTVHETVPDSVLDEAGELELVDLPPEELLRRFQEGKVYISERAAHAMQQFFRAGNLTALRELSMRRAAEHVDEEVRTYMQTRRIPGPWPVTERLLTCVSVSQASEHLVRSARRLADQLNAAWIAVFVETPDKLRLSPEEQDRLAHTLRLAEELGATTLTMSGHAVASTVLEYARAHNITKIIVGKPARPRWVEVWRASVADELIRASPGIPIHVIPTQADQFHLPAVRLVLASYLDRGYTRAVVLVVIVTGIGGLLQLLAISPANLVMFYMLAVVIAAVDYGRGPAILASLLSVLAFDFFFVPPFFTMRVSDAQYILTFIAFFTVGMVISELTSRIREQARTAQRREGETAILYAFSRKLALTNELADITRMVIDNIANTFQCKIALYVSEPAAADELKLLFISENFARGQSEYAVAMWAFKRGLPVGSGTDTLPAVNGWYLPLKTGRGIVGVLGVNVNDPEVHLGLEQRRLLEAFASLAALAIERAQLVDEAREAQVRQATERLQNALLNSISHDLRTPLVAITGALSSLQDEESRLDSATRRTLVEMAREEAERLNRLVANLLDMTRIEAGVMRLNRQPSDIQDIVGAALEQLGSRLNGRPVTVDIPPDLPFIPLDGALVVQTLVNLIDNALKYSNPVAHIEIRSRQIDRQVEVTVADRGVGIPPGDLTRVFGKFYRVQQPGNGAGIGLGLSIAKGIVEAHGGTIAAENRPGGGSIFRLALPIAGGGAAASREEYDPGEVARADRG